MPAYDFELGQKIHQLLMTRNLENPVDFTQIAKWQEELVRLDIKIKISAMLSSIGLHTSLEESSHTAERLVQFYLNERFCGLNYKNFPKITPLTNEFAYQEPLIARDIAFISTCEHHLVSIKGKALLAYIPDQQIVGLNKLNQVLTFFANRPQLQERLTNQVFYAMQEILATTDVALVINARHDCMLTSGANDHQTRHSSYLLGGRFNQDQGLKTQILAYLNVE